MSKQLIARGATAIDHEVRIRRLEEDVRLLAATVMRLTESLDPDGAAAARGGIQQILERLRMR